MDRFARWRIVRWPGAQQHPLPGSGEERFRHSKAEGRFDKARFPPQGLAGGGRGYGEARMRDRAAINRVPS
jgi:hypothetical protein